MSVSKRIKELPAGQRRAGAAIAVFFALMAAFTVLSRGLDAFTVARVASGAPSRGALTHAITLEGKAEPLGEFAVSLPSGFVVKELLLREGGTVAAGDTVAVLDTEQIARLLAEARRELESAQLDSAAKHVDAASTRKDAVTEAEIQLERAKEDALLTEETARQEVDRANSEVRRARETRNELYDLGDYTEEQIDAARYEIVRCELALETAQLAYESAMTDAQRAIADAQRAVEEAVRAEEEQARTDAAEAETKRLQSGRDSLGIAETQSRIAELEALLTAGGRVAAERSGLVTALNVTPGAVTTEGGAYLLAGEGGSIFTAMAAEEDAERLTAGDRVELVFAGMREPVSAKISSVKLPEEKGGEYAIEVILPDSGLSPGTAGTLEAVKRGGENMLVPLTALYSDGSEERGYVFVLRERKTTMGVQTVVERLDAEILDRGDSMAAVNAAFAPEDTIVTASSRPLFPGDRVRIEESE